MRRRIASYFSLFTIATIAALMVRFCVLEDFRVSSDSMFPTLYIGDLVFVNKAAYNFRFPFSTYEILKFSRPKRGEIAAFTLPDRGLETFVKRVIAGEGDQVEMHDGVLSVNGTPATYRPLPETQQVIGMDRAELWIEDAGQGKPYLIHEKRSGSKDYGPVLVPKGHFFVLGDNRLESTDSRTWGPVPYSCLKGRLALVWWSVDSRGGTRTSRIAVPVQ